MGQMTHNLLVQRDTHTHTHTGAFIQVTAHKSFEVFENSTKVGSKSRCGLMASNSTEYSPAAKADSRLVGQKIL
jgi:hypothetical protein